MTPWTGACQAPLLMEFSRQEYWSGLPFSSPGNLPDAEIEHGSPALQADSLPSESLGKPTGHQPIWESQQFWGVTEVALKCSPAYLASSYVATLVSFLSFCPNHLSLREFVIIPWMSLLLPSLLGIFFFFLTGSAIQYLFSSIHSMFVFESLYLLVGLLFQRRNSFSNFTKNVQSKM